MNEMLDNRGESGKQDAALIVRRSGTSFYWAMRLLPEPKRTAMFAIYAFCRAVDDIADGTDAPDAKRQELARYRADIEALYNGKTCNLATVAGLKPFLGRYDLASKDFLAIIKGMETDAAASVRITDGTELETYVDRVACAVGRLCCPVFGLPVAIHRDLSHSLGTALQYTNILRDLREDAARDRIYLSGDQLASAGLGGLNATDLVDTADLAVVCQPLADGAAAAFHNTDQLLRGADPEAAKPARMMREAYGRLFKKVTEAGFAPVPRKRVRLGKREKLTVMVRYGLFGV